MVNKNFINYHVLISHSPSCLNRDDMNMQKSAIFGGVRRVRISSQSLKRAIRMSHYYGAHLGAPSIRTRELERIKALLIEELRGEFDEALISETAERFVKASLGADEEENEDENAEGTIEGTEEKDIEKTKKLAVAPWVTDEIRELCRIIDRVKRAEFTEKELTSVTEKLNKQRGKKKKTEHELLDELLNKKLEKEIKSNLATLRAACAAAKDIALSGRMATSGLMTSVDGALAVAHAITTHAVDEDIDWFTAVDDLVADAGEVGAGHLNTQQFSSGVFYRYASLNLKQLQVNLGRTPSMHAPETPQSRGEALDIARHVLHLMATIVPSAKQQSFAAYNLAEFALVSFADQPISLGNAFEEPVTARNGSGFLKPSLERLTGYWETVNRKYELDEMAAFYSLREAQWPEGLMELTNLPQLEGWIAKDAKVNQG